MPRKKKEPKEHFRVVVRGGQICILDLDENGEPLYYNEVQKREEPKR